MDAKSLPNEWTGVEPDAEPEWFALIGRIDSGPEPVRVPCPSCGAQPLRYFYWRSGTPGRGGFWIWCTACRRYMHYSGSVPGWWQDEPRADARQLTHQPVWLDRHWQQLQIAQRLA